MGKKYKILVDGENVRAVKSGEMIEIPVQQGSHEIYLKIDWCQSNKIIFNIEEGEKVQFQCRYRGSWYNILYYTLLKADKYLLLEKVENLE